MKLSQYLAGIGDQHLTYQWIDQSFTDIKTSKKGITKVTFETKKITANEYAFDLSKMKMRGLVIWVPVEEIDKFEEKQMDQVTV